MAYQASTGKVYIGIKIPNENYEILKGMVEESNGELNIAGIINEALMKHLIELGHDAVMAADGRRCHKEQ